MGVHWPVVLNDVDAFGIGITPAQGLIKGDEEVDRYLAGPAMENPSGVCIQYPEDTGHRVGARATHGTGLYRSTLGCIGIYSRHFGNGMRVSLWRAVVFCSPNACVSACEAEGEWLQKHQYRYLKSGG